MNHEKSSSPRTCGPLTSPFTGAMDGHNSYRNESGEGHSEGHGALSNSVPKDSNDHQMDPSDGRDDVKGVKKVGVV